MTNNAIIALCRHVALLDLRCSESNIASLCIAFGRSGAQLLRSVDFYNLLIEFVFGAGGAATQFARVSSRGTPKQRFAACVSSVLQLFHKARTILSTPPLRPTAITSRSMKLEHLLSSDDDYEPLLRLLLRHPSIQLLANDDSYRATGFNCTALTSNGESPLAIALLRDALHCIETLVTLGDSSQFDWLMPKQQQQQSSSTTLTMSSNSSILSSYHCAGQNLLHCARSCGGISFV